MRNGLLLLLMYLTMAALYIVAAMYGGFGSWFLFGAVFLFTVYETAVLFSRHRNFQVVRHLSAQRVSAHEDVRVTLRITMVDPIRMFALQWLHIRDDVPQKLAVRMDHTSQLFFPRRLRQVTLEYTVGRVTRGNYSFSQVQLAGGDMFGLLTWRTTLRAEGRLIVHPETRLIRNWQVMERSPAGTRAKQGYISDDATKVIGVRDYVQGDRLSRIHWPASARTGALRSKEFEHDLHNKVVFILDSFRDADDLDVAVFELALSVLGSLVEHVFRAQQPFGLMSFAGTFAEFSMAQGDCGFLRVMGHLAMVDAGEKASFSDEFWRLSSVPRQTTVVLVTAAAREDLLRVAVLAHERQLRVTLFIVRQTIPTVGAVEDATISRLRALGWQVNALHALEELDDLLGRGAHVVRT